MQRVVEANTTLIIEAGRAERHYWRDIWRYRELFYFLAWRDVLVRYKQTAIGISWAIVRPVATMLIFTLVFGRIANLPSSGVPYNLLVFTGLVPWLFFASGLGDSSNSLLTNSNLLSKVYFPRILVPVSALAVALVDLVISLGLLVILMAWAGFVPTARAFTLPLFILLPFGAALGLGFWFSALNVRYRDFQFVIPFLLMCGLYLSPIGYSSAVVPEHWRLLFSVNPMVGVIDGIRWALLGGDFMLHMDALLVSVCWTFLLLVSGIWFFRRTEKSFADVI